MEAGGMDLYPPYDTITSAKQHCCLPEVLVTVTKSRVDMPLQALLDLTARRLCQAQYPLLQNLIAQGAIEFTLYSIWGCDGSGGHSTYKQKFDDASSSDASLFMFSFVPLHLRTSSTAVYTWQNPAPGATRYCRPLKFLFAKETAAATIAETDLVRDQISKLEPTVVLVDSNEIRRKHEMVLTMVNGKVANALTNTKSTQACFICGATPKHIKGTLPLPPDKPENYAFGMSTLHAWIRSFEFLLNIAYRLELCTNRVSGDHEKQKKEKKKRLIQQEFMKKLGLHVDKPKQGLGNSNDGNTARLFYENAEISASITGLDKDL